MVKGIPLIIDVFLWFKVYRVCDQFYTELGGIQAHRFFFFFTIARYFLHRDYRHLRYLFLFNNQQK